MRNVLFRLESFLAIAVVALLFQLFPSLWFATLWGLDVRNWPRTVWFIGNGMILLTLLAVRFAPDLYAEWKVSQTRKWADQDKKRHQRELKEQREAIRRIQESRERRLY